MSKAVEFIENYTRNCSNEMTFEDGSGSHNYDSWLTPDEARKAVEIEREEIYEWLRVNLCNYFDAPRSMFEKCLEDLKVMKNE